MVVPFVLTAKLLLHHQNYLRGVENNEAPSSSSHMLLDGYTEILEALVVEGFRTLAHPSLKTMYPSDVDKLSVLLDVWGLGDRDIVTVHAA